MSSRTKRLKNSRKNVHYANIDDFVGRQVAAKTLDQGITQMASADFVSIVQQLPEELSPLTMTSETIIEFFKTDLHDSSQGNARKLVAAAALIAAKRGIISPVFADPRVVAYAIDRGVEMLKVAYKVSEGTLNAIEAVEETYDTAVVQIADAVEDSIKEYGPAAAKGIAETIKAIYPQTKVFTPIIEKVLAFASPAIAKVVGETVKVIGETVKTIAKTVASTVKNVAENSIKLFS